MSKIFKIGLNKTADWFTVAGKMNGKPVTLMVDTGAGKHQLLLNPLIAKQSKLETIENVGKLAGIHGEESVDVALVNKLALGDQLNLEDLPAILTKGLSQFKKHYDGIIGLGLLEKHNAVIDIGQKQLRLMA